MSWVVHRQATDEDYVRLERTCEDFIRTYFAEFYWLIEEVEQDAEVTPDAWYRAAQTTIYLDTTKEREMYLRPIFLKRIRRALRDDQASASATIPSSPASTTR